mmetsp:Transcript_102443/g.319163  ORF Transcript_102443/g.319163 Transcript_102443/m.319163 type:complete len:207 (-) Transcript_102443:565-1185(-)
MVPPRPAKTSVPLSLFVTVRSTISGTSSKKSLAKRLPSRFQSQTPSPAQVAKRTPKFPASRICLTFDTGASCISGEVNSSSSVSSSAQSLNTRTAPHSPATATSQGPAHAWRGPSSSSRTSMSLTPPMSRLLMDSTSAFGSRRMLRLPFDVPPMKGPASPAHATAVTPGRLAGPSPVAPTSASGGLSINSWLSCRSSSWISTARSL